MTNVASITIGHEEGARMGHRRRLPLAIAVFLLGIGTTMHAADAAQDSASVIRAALEQWRDDFNARKSDRICDLFATDLRYDFRGLPEQTYPLLCARLHHALADNSKQFRYRLEIKDILVSGSLAAVRLTWIATVALPDKTSTTTKEPGMDIFRRQPDGEWKIVRYLAYEDE